MCLSSAVKNTGAGQVKIANPHTRYHLKSKVKHMICIHVFIIGIHFFYEIVRNLFITSSSKRGPQDL